MHILNEYKAKSEVYSHPARKVNIILYHIFPYIMT